MRFSITWSGGNYPTVTMEPDTDHDWAVLAVVAGSKYVAVAERSQYAPYSGVRTIQSVTLSQEPVAVDPAAPPLEDPS